MQHKYDSLVTNVRGRGLFLALDLPDAETRNRMVDICMEEGIFVLSCGASTLRLRPTLTFSEDDVDEAISKLDAAFGRGLTERS